MCGVVGIVSQSPVNLELYDALTVLQHRGQDAAGIVTIDGGNCFRQRKANGLVRDVFEQKHMRRLQGQIGIGHVRYPTAGSSSAAEAQPFYVNSPYGIALAHNGNLTNSRELKIRCEEAHRHVNTSSDSEILLNIFAWKLSLINAPEVTAGEVFEAIRGVNEEIVGAYAVVALIIGGGLGNLADRIFRPGNVVDFVDTIWFGIDALRDIPLLKLLSFERWPTWNFADACVVVAVAILVVGMISEEIQTRKKKKQSA